MAKFLVQGRDAGRILELPLRQPRRRPRRGSSRTRSGSTRAGKLEADLTVTKLDDERFWVVASDTAHRHVRDVDAAPHPGDAHAFVTDVTRAYAQINIQGPALARADAVGDDAPISRTTRSRSAPRARSTSATRARSAFASPTWASSDTSSTSRRSRRRTSTTGLWRRASTSACGTRGSRRSPACAWRRATATTATTSTTPTRPRGGARLRGRPEEARRLPRTRRRRSRRRPPARSRDARAGPRERPGAAACSTPRSCAGTARRSGYIRAASYGFTLGGAVGLAMIEAGEPVTRPTSRRGSWEVEIAGKLYPAVASLKPLYDPEMKRIKC